MAYQFTQTGAQIQSILDQVGTNTGDISSLNATVLDINSGRSNNEPSAVSVPNGTWTLLASVSITDPGLYLFIAGALFDANGTGARKVGYSTNTATSPSGRRSTSTNAYSSGSTAGAEIVKLLQYTNSGTFCVWGAQNSGSSLNAQPWIEMIRLK